MAFVTFDWLNYFLILFLVTSHFNDRTVHLLVFTDNVFLTALLLSAYVRITANLIDNFGSLRAYLTHLNLCTHAFVFSLKLFGTATPVTNIDQILSLSSLVDNYGSISFSLKSSLSLSFVALIKIVIGEAPRADHVNIFKLRAQWSKAISILKSL